MQINFPGGLDLDFHVDSFDKGGYWKESAKEDRITITLKDGNQSEVTLYFTVSEALRLSDKLKDLVANKDDGVLKDE